MTIQINGSGTITGISVGGLEDGCVDAGDIAVGAVTPAKLSTGGPNWDSSGRLLVGTSTGKNVGSSQQARVQIKADANNSVRGVSIYDDNETPGMFMGRGASAVSSGTGLGVIAFAGHDGTDLETTAAHILCEVDGTPGANDMPGRLVFSTTPDGSATPVERLRITQDGATQSTNNTTNFRCINNGGSGIALIYFQTSSAELGKIRINGAGVAYDTTSDYRLKENIEPITDAIARLQALKPWRFNFISHPDVTVDGFLAHEAQEVVPEAVGGTKDEVDAEGNPVYQGIDQSKLVPLLTAALQEAVAKIETLEAQNAQFEARLTALEGGSN